MELLSRKYTSKGSKSPTTKAREDVYDVLNNNEEKYTRVLVGHNDALRAQLISLRLINTLV